MDPNGATALTRGGNDATGIDRCVAALGQATGNRAARDLGHWRRRPDASCHTVGRGYMVRAPPSQRVGRRFRAPIGTWPAIGVREARQRALSTLADLQDGGDPVARRRGLAAQAEKRAPGFPPWPIGWQNGAKRRRRCGPTDRSASASPVSYRDHPSARETRSAWSRRGSNGRT